MPTHWRAVGTSLNLNWMTNFTLQEFFNNLIGLITTRVLLLFEELAQVKDALFSVLLWGVEGLAFCFLGFKV